MSKFSRKKRALAAVLARWGKKTSPTVPKKRGRPRKTDIIPESLSPMEKRKQIPQLFDAPCHEQDLGGSVSLSDGADEDSSSNGSDDQSDDDYECSENENDVSDNSSDENSSENLSVDDDEYEDVANISSRFAVDPNQPFLATIDSLLKLSKSFNEACNCDGKAEWVPTQQATRRRGGSLRMRWRCSGCQRSFSYDSDPTQETRKKIVAGVYLCRNPTFKIPPILKCNSTEN